MNAEIFSSGRGENGSAFFNRIVGWLKEMTYENKSWLRTGSAGREFFPMDTSDFVRFHMILLVCNAVHSRIGNHIAGFVFRSQFASFVWYSVTFAYRNSRGTVPNLMRVPPAGV